LNDVIECHYAVCHYDECHYTECRYAECRYAECRYAECRYAECRGAVQRPRTDLFLLVLSKLCVLSPKLFSPSKLNFLPKKTVVNLPQIP
jgi:hypothetical protein